MHSLLKGKPNNRKTYCLATMILLTTMTSCKASSPAQYVQPPKSFRPFHLRISTQLIQALHNQPHSSATAVRLLLRNPIDFDITYVVDNRHQEQDESNPASSCRADQREPPSAVKTCGGMHPIINELPHIDLFLLDGSYTAILEKTVTKAHKI